MNYKDIRKEYISLINRSIKQKVFADEDTLGTSPNIINSILQKYSSDVIKIEFIKNNSVYILHTIIDLPWEANPFDQTKPLDISNPSLSLFLNLKDFLRKVTQKEISESANMDLENGDFDKYFNTVEYRLNFLKKETNKILNSIPEMKKETIFQLFLLKKENEYLLKWRELKRKRLKRIFDLQEKLEETWLQETEIKDGEKVFIKKPNYPKFQKGLVWKIDDIFIPVMDITKPYGGRTGYLKNNELFDIDGNKSYDFSERSLFLNNEYTLNILPFLVKTS